MLRLEGMRIVPDHVEHIEHNLFGLRWVVSEMQCYGIHQSAMAVVELAERLPVEIACSDQELNIGYGSIAAQGR